MDDKASANESIRYLPEDYEATPTDVLCGRGRKCYFHPGNVRFRDIVQCHLNKYAEASSKMEKGQIITIVYEEICEQSVLGGFIKKDENGRWYDVGEFLAREKVSQAFRDALQDKYKSSTTSKRKRRELLAMSSELHSQRSLCSYTSVSTEPSIDVLERVAMKNLQVEQDRVTDQLLDLLDKDLECAFSSHNARQSEDRLNLSFRGWDDNAAPVYQPDLLASQSSHAVTPGFSRFDLMHRGSSCPKLGWQGNSSRSSLENSIAVISTDGDEEDFEPLQFNSIHEIDTSQLDLDMIAFD